MSRAEPQPKKPEYRVPTAIPTNWCLDCQLTLRTAEEYKAHIHNFPSHYVKAVGSLICPRCGKDVTLEDGLFSEHWVEYPKRKCLGSGEMA